MLSTEDRARFVVTAAASLSIEDCAWFVLRGYCTPDQSYDCLCIYLKNYNTLMTS